MRSSFSGVASVVAGASALAAAAHASVAPTSAAGIASSKEVIATCFASSNSCTSVSYAFRFFVAVAMFTAVVRARFNATSTFPVAAAVASDALDQRTLPLSAAAATRYRTRFHREHSRNAFQRRSHVFAILPSFSHVFTVFLPHFASYYSR